MNGLQIEGENSPALSFREGLKGDNTSVLQELTIACRRTLHEEVSILHNRKSIDWYHSTVNRRKRPRIASPDASSDSNNTNGFKSCDNANSADHTTRTWTEIIQDICDPKNFLTDEQYDYAARLISICLLTYVMTQRCNVVKDDDTIVNGDSNITNNSSVEEKKQVLLSLEEILNDSPQSRNVPSSQISLCTLTNERVSSAFWDFLHHALSPFLAMKVRAARHVSPGTVGGTSKSIKRDVSISNSGSADLLHVLAMIICGDIPQSARLSAIMGSNVDGNEISYDLSNRVKKLMSNHQPRYFQISALQRGETIRVIADSLALSKVSDDETQSLFMGGIVHLRAALKGFNTSLALSDHQAIDARRVLNTIAIDTECFAHNEMKDLVSILLSDRTKYRHCAQFHRSGATNLELNYHTKRYIHDPRMAKAGDSTLRQQVIRQQELSEDICILCSAGDLLRDLIVRYNGSRHYADGKFSSQTVAELTAAIATILGEVDSSVDNESVDGATLPTTCAIEGLLHAARMLYYFLLSPASDVENSDITPEIKEARALENTMKEALVDCVVQFLGSNNCRVMKGASSLLANAFAYEKKSRVKSLVAKVFLILQTAVQKPGACEALKEIIEVLSRISEQFAVSMFILLIKVLEERKDGGKFIESKSTAKSIAQLLATVAVVQPRVIPQYLKKLHETLESFRGDAEVTKQLIAVLLSSRLSNPYLKNDHEKVIGKIEDFLEFQDSWSVFQIARHALSTANFQVASTLFGKRLQRNTSTSSSYLWLSMLSSVATAESVLLEEGNSGISTSLSKLCSALNKARALKSRRFPSSISFQEEMIALRIDFLELCLVTLNLSGEIRLTNTLSRFTRDWLYRRNLPRCFYMLASRYAKVYGRYGIFYCQHTRSTLRCLGAACKFLGDTVRKMFSNQKDEKWLNRAVGEFPKGDTGRVQTQLIEKLKTDLLGLFDSSIQPKLRAITLLSVLDSFLKCPTAYPRGFTTSKKIPQGIRILISSLNSSCTKMPMNNFQVQLGKPLQLRVNGFIPETFFKICTVPFSQIAATCSSTFDGPLTGDYDDEKKRANLREDGEVGETITTSTELLPTTNMYNINTTKVGVRKSVSRFVLDLDLPVFPEEGYYSINVKLFLRDVRCGEFEVDKIMDGERIIVEVHA